MEVLCVTPRSDGGSFRTPSAGKLVDSSVVIVLKRETPEDYEQRLRTIDRSALMAELARAEKIAARARVSLGRLIHGRGGPAQVRAFEAALFSAAAD